MKKDFWFMPLFAGVAFIFAAGLHISLIWFLFNLCLICIILTLIYRWRNWINLDIDRIISGGQASVEAGTDLIITLQARTFGLLPWPWIQIRDILPKSLTECTEHILPKIFVWAVKDVLWQSEYSIPKVRRGAHTWDVLEYKSGDLLGFTSYTGCISKPVSLIVYPKTFDLPIDDFFPRQTRGAAASKKALQLDKEQPVGIRDYQPGDGISRIAWKSTAKMGKLQSKEFESLICDSFHIVLDCSADRWEDSYDPSFEEAVIAAASLVKASAAAHIPVTFYSNTNEDCRQIYVDNRASYRDFLLQMAFIDAKGKDNIINLLHKEIFVQSSNMILISSHRGIGLEKVLKQRAIRGSLGTLILVNRNFTAKNYKDALGTSFYKRIIIKKAEDLVWNISRR